MLPPLVGLHVGGEGAEVTLTVTYVVQVHGTSMTNTSGETLETLYRWHIDHSVLLSPAQRDAMSGKLISDLESKLGGVFGVTVDTPFLIYDTRPLECMWQTGMSTAEGPTSLTQKQIHRLGEVFPVWWMNRCKEEEVGPDGYPVLFRARWGIWCQTRGRRS